MGILLGRAPPTCCDQSSWKNQLLHLAPLPGGPGTFWISTSFVGFEGGMSSSCGEFNLCSVVRRLSPQGVDLCEGRLLRCRKPCRTSSAGSGGSPSSAPAAASSRRPAAVGRC